MTFLELAKKRYSVRKFKPDPISDKDIEYILEAGRIAPSAANMQPWQFIVIKDEKIKNEVNELYHRDWFDDAPVAIIILADHRQSWHRKSDGKDHADIDVAIAADHMMLAAADKGLGTCWVCNFEVQKTINYFNLPEYMEPVVIFPLGYPDNEVDMERHKEKRKPLKEILHIDGWSNPEK